MSIDHREREYAIQRTMAFSRWCSQYVLPGSPARLVRSFSQLYIPLPPSRARLVSNNRCDPEEGLHLPTSIDFPVMNLPSSDCRERSIWQDLLISQVLLLTARNRAVLATSRGSVSLPSGTWMGISRARNKRSCYIQQQQIA